VALDSKSVPWYGLWVVAAALLAPRGRFSQTLMLLALLTPLRYLPDVAATLGPVSSAALAVLASLPLLRLFGRARRARTLL